MKAEYRWVLVVALLASPSLEGCRKVVTTAAEEEDGPAKVEHLKGAEPARVTLTPEAVKRLDIRTATVRDLAIEGATHRVIPYAAVLYDTGGDTWTYINTAPGVYVRHHITVDRVAGDQAILLEGPAVGTVVVIVGGAELYGSETEFEEE